ncbi:hypothetical protein AAMO2058_001698600 [Amorphochlora amoebiformis]
MKLKRAGLLRPLRIRQRWGGIVLTPFGATALSPSDKELVVKYGLGVVDCSWARVDQVTLTIHQSPIRDQDILISHISRYPNIPYI